MINELLKSTPMREVRGNMNIRILNAVENAILNYSKQHPAFIGNPYQFFAEKLGYKSKNYLYRWFKDRDSSKIGLSDVRKIIEITGDTKIADIICEELKNNL